MVKDFDTIDIDASSGAGLCVLCDNAIMEGHEGIVYHHGHAYIAHAFCIEEEWNNSEEDND